MSAIDKSLKKKMINIKAELETLKSMKGKCFINLVTSFVLFLILLKVHAFYDAHTILSIMSIFVLLILIRYGLQFITYKKTAKSMEDELRDLATDES
ncbi:hypothetical protein VCHA53O466_50338 [Vibrio chagasii]|nr:hypothetical protein VCHA53O466_50338 [Vibrio chagasii]